ncbi:CvpA family protein [Desulfococcaceae bacterium HSG8]|nr:CvpA family protein [Desulfococcaceae bacterium HSG8]
MRKLRLTSEFQLFTVEEIKGAMNLLDILLIVIVVYFVTMGFFRGLFREIVSIIGVFAGFYPTSIYYMMVAKHLSRWISDPSYLNIGSFLLIFFSIFILIGILGIIAKYLLKVVTFGWLDRASGIVFALVKGILVTSVILISLTAFLKKGTPVIKDSLLAPHLTFVSEKMTAVSSEDIKNKFKLKIKPLKEAWKGKS